MQRGTIYKKHNAWYVVYRIEEIVDGEPLRKQKTHRLAAVSDEYRSAKDVEQLAVDHLRPLNIGSITPESSMTVADFAEKHFLPNIKAKKKPSTLKFYTDIVDNHIAPSLGSLKLREVTTSKIQQLLDSRSSLSQTS
ncbi:MAG: hypothetical protein WBQ87_00040, partial [Candidatus Sulfotelmatobacter sp.]